MRLAMNHYTGRKEQCLKIRDILSGFLGVTNMAFLQRIAGSRILLQGFYPDSERRDAQSKCQICLLARSPTFTPFSISTLQRLLPFLKLHFSIDLTLNTRFNNVKTNIKLLVQANI